MIRGASAAISLPWMMPIVTIAVLATLQFTAARRFDAAMRGHAVSSLLNDMLMKPRDDGSYPINPDYPFLASMEGDHRVVVDVGLKDGVETQTAVDSGFVVYSFEPVPDHCEETRSRMRKRHLAYHDVQLDHTGNLLSPLPPPQPGKGICYLFCVAAGAKHSWKTFYQDPFLGHGSSFHDPKAKEYAKLADNKNESGKKHAFQVQIVPVSQYVNTDVYFFKLDSQGHDMDVLLGAKQLFMDHTVRLVGMELWPKGLELAGVSVEAIMDMLTSRLGLLCFDKTDVRQDQDDELIHHHEKFAPYMQIAEQITGRRPRWGWYTDFICLNTVKIYSHSETPVALERRARWPELRRELAIKGPSEYMIEYKTQTVVARHQRKME